MWVTYFKHRSLHKYTRVERGQDSLEIKSTIDLVLVKRGMLGFVQDVRAVRGMGCGLSDHYVKSGLLDIRRMDSPEFMDKRIVWSDKGGK